MADLQGRRIGVELYPVQDRAQKIAQVRALVQAHLVGEAREHGALALDFLYFAQQGRGRLHLGHQVEILTRTQFKGDNSLFGTRDILGVHAAEFLARGLHRRGDEIGRLQVARNRAHDGGVYLRRSEAARAPAHGSPV